ncbi:hypothetical protein K439DRAFT_1664826 [Ramaria rubella]|nr:hypothetical protein K439DRAFT_1664826 [Ramaria rubella]
MLPSLQLRAYISPNAAVNITWLVFNIAGQCCLLILLLTIAFAKPRPQRSNPFLINFFLTTLLATIPPAFLFYTGHLSAHSPPPPGLCFVQAALVDGVAPMFGIAQAALSFDTWSETRALCVNTQKISRISWLRYTLLAAPYLLMWIFVFTSFMAASQSQAAHLAGYVYCINDSGPSNSIRNFVGLIMLVFAVIDLGFALGVGWFMYLFSSEKHKDLTAWRINKQFALRVSILATLQLLPLILSVCNSSGINSYPLKIAYELLVSMNSLAVFFIFGTQRSILEAWKIRKRTMSTGEGTDELPPPYSLSWVVPPQRGIFEEALSDRPTDDYFRPWLRPGTTTPLRHFD